MIEVAPNPDHLAVLDVNDVGERRFGRDAACLTAPAETGERDNPVPRIPDLREFEAGIAENVPDVAQSLKTSTFSCDIVRAVSRLTERLAGHREPRGLDLVQLHADLTTLAKLLRARQSASRSRGGVVVLRDTHQGHARGVHDPRPG